MEYRLSFRDDENVLQLNSDGGHTVLNALKIIKLCTLWNINYISIMLFKKSMFLKMTLLHQKKKKKEKT